MIRSTSEELGEYDLICRPEHIAKVWSVIENALSVYWAKFIKEDQQADSRAKLAAKFGKPSARKKKKEDEFPAKLFDEAVSSYEKEAQKYRRFFSAEALEEYHDDPNAFKQVLSRDVPVIANTLRQRRPELKEWQALFRSARANDLLEVFSNVIDFKDDWSEEHPATGYNQFVEADEPEAFDLDPLDNDEAMSLIGVIGMGIKSIVLYHLDPERMPARGRDAIYSLYFLSNKKPYGLPSETSEFLMVNDQNPAPDGSLIMDQNYWYPYGLFSLYALRVFGWIDKRATSAKVTLDRSLRYVYVNRFFEAVCAVHKDDLRTMRAHERFEVPA